MANRIPATKANMRKYAGQGYIAYSFNTGEEYSATPGDYFMQEDNWRMKDRQGRGMFLVKKIISYR